MIRVAIVDDHPVARRGLSEMLRDAGDVQIVSAVASVRELPQSGDAGGTTAYDVVVLDLYHDGPEPCVASVARLSGRTKVLVISASARADDVLAAVRAGASGYLTKHVGAAMLASAVETVVAGGFALSAELADIMHGAATGSGSVRHQSRVEGEHRLSAREEEALRLVASGFTHAQVARRMGVTKSTVDTYIERVRSKLQLGNKAELTRAAMERTRERNG